MSTLNTNIIQAIDDFKGIKGAIEEKGITIETGTHTSEYAEKISEIETGITPEGTKDIIENGMYDISEYAEVDVQIPQPSGKIIITENGNNIDVAEYATADIDVDTHEEEIIEMNLANDLLENALNGGGS